MRLFTTQLSAIATLLLLVSTSHAAPTYFTADAVLPGGLATLTAERANFHNAATSAGISLTLEGFEAFSAGNPIDFGPFTAEVLAGTGFSQISGNNLITTQGNSVLSFDTSGSTSVEFTFDTPIHALGVDITSIDFTGTHVSFLNDNGDTLNDFAIPGVFAGASFFGVVSTQSFSTARFDFTGSEILNFDQLEFGAVPEPSTLALATLGFWLASCGRRKR